MIAGVVAEKEASKESQAEKASLLGTASLWVGMLQKNLSTIKVCQFFSLV